MFRKDQNFIASIYDFLDRLGDQLPFFPSLRLKEFLLLMIGNKKVFSCLKGKNIKAIIQAI